MSSPNTEGSDAGWLADNIPWKDVERQNLDPAEILSPQLPSAAHPQRGILCQSVVGSPTVNWILPVRIRSTKHNDIAFVGASFVRIYELQDDGQLDFIAEYSRFNCKIQGALVYGEQYVPFEEPDKLSGLVNPERPVKDKTKEAPPVKQQQRLPPQLLLLVLQTGDIMFLGFPSGSSKTWAASVRLGHGRKVDTHFSIAMEPSMRFLAISAYESYTIYGLKPYSLVQEEFAATGRLDPIATMRGSAFRQRGSILHINFLHPRPQDGQLVVLLIIFAQTSPSCATHMILTDWMAGDHDIFAKEAISSQLPVEHNLPIMVIPMKVELSFLIVSQQRVSFVENGLSGVPKFCELEDEMKSIDVVPTLDRPVWTQWARPFRRKDIFDKTDLIYLAREDGAVAFVELGVDDTAPSVIPVNRLGINIDLAFATVDNKYYDILIVGGDSGPGGVWKVKPRQGISKINNLGNWAPVLDAAVVTGQPVREGAAASDRENSLSMLSDNGLGDTSRLFTASGRRPLGTVSEWRLGVPAQITLDIDLGEPVRQAWIFYKDQRDPAAGFQVILAFPYSTTILEVAGDFNNVESIPPEDSPLDTAYRTIHAAQSPDGTLVQVTESNIVVTAQDESSTIRMDAAFQAPGISADIAHSTADVLAVSATVNGSSVISTFQLQGTVVTSVAHFSVPGEATCVYCITEDAKNMVLVGDVKEGRSVVGLYDLQGREIQTWSLTTGLDTGTQSHIRGDSLTSISEVHQDGAGRLLCAGTRHGKLLQLRLDMRNAEQPIRWTSEKIGDSSVTVFPSIPSDENVAFACRGHNLLRIAEWSGSEDVCTGKFFVWPIDQHDLSKLSPPVSSLCCLPQDSEWAAGNTSALLVSGSSILFVEIKSLAVPVPRHIPVEGNPLRVIYSRSWECLVVATEVDNYPRLEFIDPDTGESISRPCDKSKKPVEFVSGLNHEDDSILSLHEWIYEKDGRMFAFLIVGTKKGTLIIVSLERDAMVDQNGPRRFIHWTRFRKREREGPIYSISGNLKHIVYCSGPSLRVEHLHPVDKKFKLAFEAYKMESPVISIRVVGNTIYALTATSSLHVLRIPDEIPKLPMGNPLILLYEDNHTRAGFSMIDIGVPTIENGFEEYSPIHLVSTQDGVIAGLSAPLEPGRRDMQEVITGQVSCPVRKFVRAYARPSWVGADPERRYGTLPTGTPDSAVLGLGLNGEMYHFTLLNGPLQAFLWFIMQRGLQSASPLLQPATIEPGSVDDVPANHTIRQNNERYLSPTFIDGDMLRRCLRLRLLERNIYQTRDVRRLLRLLDNIEGGKYTKPFREAVRQRAQLLGNDDDSDVKTYMDDEQLPVEEYFQLAYTILDYLLAPSLRPSFPVHGGNVTG